MGNINVDGKDYITGVAGNVEPAIEWLESAVCYADGCQWLMNDDENCIVKPVVLDYDDFQLNTIKQGDYIEASELDTEQKYNDVVEVFELFGFESNSRTGFVDGYEKLVINAGGYYYCNISNHKYRKLTYQQIMAIGELKRLEIERDKKLTPKVSRQACAEYYETHNIDGTLKASMRKFNFSEMPNSCEDEKPPYHIERDGDKYHREIVGLDGTKTTVDVYRVLDAFKTGCAATDHAIKKILCAGLRGHKDKLTDYDNAIESLQAAKELLMQKSSNENTN